MYRFDPATEGLHVKLSDNAALLELKYEPNIT